MKSGSYRSNFGSKGQRSTFRRLSGCTYFLTGYLNTSWSVFLPTLYTDSGWWKKYAQKVEDKLSFIKVSKGRCPKALDDSVDFSVLCQVGRFTFLFCYQFLMIFLCFGIFSFDRTSYFTFILPGRRDIVQVVQAVQIDRAQIWHLS